MVRHSAFAGAPRTAYVPASQVFDMLPPARSSLQCHASCSGGLHIQSVCCIAGAHMFGRCLLRPRERADVRKREPSTGLRMAPKARRRMAATSPAMTSAARLCPTSLAMFAKGRRPWVERYAQWLRVGFDRAPLAYSALCADDVDHRCHVAGGRLRRTPLGGASAHEHWCERLCAVVGTHSRRFAVGHPGPHPGQSGCSFRSRNTFISCC